MEPETASSHLLPDECSIPKKDSNTLNQQFEEKVRPCIDLIDSLRSLGVEKDLALPAIAVIGDQSSGKSSVLEALSGVALPRGSGIVTRCPLELKMKRLKEGQEWFAKITYQDTVKDIDDPSDVERLIREAQDDMAGIGVGISNDLISLEISSPDVPDLTLIDLPGIARVAVKGQPENIGEQIKRLIRQFITKQETINLIVVPCNVDIATTEALKMAQEVDPEGERTLGILTKPDLVDRGTEDTVVEIVHNEVIRLKKGYMIVKCRGQQEILEKLSLSEAIEREEAFFQAHPYFSTLLNEGYATIPNLAEKLTLELVNHIERSLPHLEEQIEAKLAETYAELEKYGEGPPTDNAEKILFLIDKVTEFTQDIINLTTGEELKNGEKLNLFSSLRTEFADWKSHLDLSGEKFNKKIMDEVCGYEIKYRGRELPGFINYKTFEVLVKDQLRKLEEPAVKKIKTVTGKKKKSSYFFLVTFYIQGKIETIKQGKESTAESMVRTQFKMELIVYTQDSTYSNSLTNVKDQENGSMVRKDMLFSTNSNATLQEMKWHIRSYYHIASQRLADQIPLVICYQILQESATQLRREMLQMLQEKENVEYLLKEEIDIGSKRATLLGRIKRLTEARSYLVAF
ncbi:interferon-induced GTP-binding protein Mx3-like [Arapaima gigas]